VGAPVEAENYPFGLGAGHGDWRIIMCCKPASRLGCGSPIAGRFMYLASVEQSITWAFFFF
jgi:hypothetical protein